MFGGSTSPNGPGEIMMRGRHVFMGYLSDEAKTKEAIDAEGWLHSGDIGRVDSNGLLYITGRIKVRFSLITTMSPFQFTVLNSVCNEKVMISCFYN